MKKANQVATWLLAASVILLVASEEYARRTWKARATEAEAQLGKVSFRLMALEVAHTQTESWVAPLVRPAAGGRP